MEDTKWSAKDTNVIRHSPNNVTLALRKMVQASMVTEGTGQKTRKSKKKGDLARPDSDSKMDVWKQRSSPRLSQPVEGKKEGI